MRLIERSNLSGRVDAVRGVISGVKLIGTKSANGRTYPPDVLSAAASKYEGVKVFVDHSMPGEGRSYRDLIGDIRNVQFREGGLFGDLHLNLKHPAAEQILYDAEHAPHRLGFSHDAEGSSVQRGGDEVVEEILRVRSVDLVAEPASTHGLFESRQGDPWRARLTGRADAPSAAEVQRFRERILREQGDEPEPVATVKPDDDPGAAEIASALTTAAQAIVTKWFDGEIEDGEAMKKLKELRKMLRKSVPPPEPVEMPTDPDDPLGDNLPKDLPQMAKESWQAPVDSRDFARRLCGRPPESQLTRFRERILRY
ncbi:MAG: hypothetical protein ACYTG0_37695 [Planctomycetota bacterium]|jgi:hypothetical protein